jgi:bzd-type benzoyl-CoA reductase N subunit
MAAGLSAVKEIYQNKTRRAEELKLSGTKIIGYFCCFPPVELMTAIGLFPYRITGDAHEQITRGDAYLETIMCPYLRSCFDLAVKGRYRFLSGLVVPHSCDSIHRIYDLWRYYCPPAFAHFIDVPHMTHAGSVEFFRHELERFKQGLEKYAQREISPLNLVQAINLHNENRALLRKLYSFRQHNPPLLSGVETMQILIAGMSLSVKEYNELLQDIIREIPAREERSEERKPRILIYGSEIDNTDFIALIEQCGADVVMDDLCTGTRQFWHDVEIRDDPLEALAAHYLLKIPCPRTYKPRIGNHEEDLENRFGYLREYVTQFQVEGVILYIIRFCDTYGFDVPDVKEYLEAMGLPVLYLEEDYKITAPERLKTQLQTFFDLIG